MTRKTLSQHTVFWLIVATAGLSWLVLPFGQSSAGTWLAVRGGLAGAFFLGLGWMAGQVIVPKEPPFWRAFLGTLSVLALTMTVGAAAYYAHDLGRASVAMALLATAVMVGGARLVRAAKTKDCGPFGAVEKGEQANSWYAGVAGLGDPASAQGSARALVGMSPDRTRAHIILCLAFRILFGLVAAAVAVALIAYAFTLLHGSATAGSIRSPWDVVPRMFFIVTFFAGLATLAAAGGLTPRIALIPAVGLTALAVSVATLVYSTGFGFDPFIHRATEAAIFRDGVISPKPLYYVGQYALVTVLARMLGGHVPGIDAWLVPTAFALLVPCAYWSLRRAFGFAPSAAAAAAASVLLLPLSSFAVTTPQGVANVIFLMTAFLALPAMTARAFPRWALFLFAAAAATIHPLAGVPLLMLVTLVALLSASPESAPGDRAAEREPSAAATARMTRVKRAMRIVAALLVTLVGSVALPAMFVVNSMVSGADVTVDAAALRSPGAVIETLQADPVATRQFSALYDLTYAWRAWRTAIIVLLAALGLTVAWRRSKTGFAYLAAALALAANYVLLKSVVEFSFLISYERSNYADRLAELSLFALAPLMAAAIAAVMSRAGRHVPTVRVMAAVLLAAFITSSVYLAYPRRDKYENSRGWSTSAADVAAARAIQKDADGRDYVVLANQSTSAAAVGAFGFARYYPSKNPADPAPVFYYPIPTGGPLYQAFLDANAALGSRESVTKAMDLAGTDTAYYVVSYYWWHAQEIILNARRHADASWIEGEGDARNYVFKYVR